jgi:hypothetical protein
MYQMISPLLMMYNPIGYPYVDDRDLFINSVINIPGPPGPMGPCGSTGTFGLVPVTIVKSTPYNVDLSNYFIGVNVDSTSSIVLPSSPVGTIFVIKDIRGNTSKNKITITAKDEARIDGKPNIVISTAFGSLTLIFNGLSWNSI